MLIACLTGIQPYAASNAALVDFALGTMAHIFPWFVTPCLEAFSYLESRFGFDAPVIEQLGRECFIRYH